MTVYSGYATLFIVTAVFPFVILIISIVNLLPGYSTDSVMGIFFQILPDLGPIQELLESIVTNLKDQSGGLLASAAAVTTLWSASAGVNAFRKGLVQLDENMDRPEADSETEPESEEEAGLLAKGKSLAKDILKRLIFTLTLIILIPALLVFEMLGSSIVAAIQSILDKLDPEKFLGVSTNIDTFFDISSLIVIAFLLFVILQMYATLPDIRRTIKSQLPGALTAGACALAFTKIFTFFIPRFYHASSLYGSLASLFLLLLWLRYVVMILFAGCALNRAIEEEKTEQQE